MAGRTSRIGALVAALALFAAVPAYAQNDPSVDGYGGPGGQIEDQVGGDRDVAGDQGRGEAVPVSDVTAGDDDGGALPFTGLDLALLAMAGALLLGLGLGMRRLTRAGPHQA